VTGESEEQRALALLQKEMLAFILEGVTERIERGEAPVLADAVAVAISRQVEAAIDSGLRSFDLPSATRIAEEAARIARAEAIAAPAAGAFVPQAPGEDPEGLGEEERRPGWRRVAAPLWLIVPLLLLLGLAGWFAWQKSSALSDEAAARTRIAVERDALSGELCKSAKARQEQVAALRNSAVYKANCPPQPGGPPDFCQTVEALDVASTPGADCGGR